MSHRWIKIGYDGHYINIQAKKRSFLKLNQMRRAHNDRKFTSEAREDEIYSANRKA